MTRKFNSKRARRHRQMQKRTGWPHADPTFQAACDALVSIFARYAASDVAISLSVSDLWRPNRSSQVKHALSFAILVSMPVASFSSRERIDSYPRFKTFIEQIYATLPSIAALEDYVPEADWGEIKYPSKGTNFHIFYGGPVERISDFIGAFDLIHAENPQARMDMHCALLAQDHIIRCVERSVTGSADYVKAGHIETPAEDFWIACREGLLSLSKCSELEGASEGLVGRLGARPPPDRAAAFGASVVGGGALPGFLVDIDGRRFPLALRNAAAATIDYWATKRHTASPAAIADFVERRFRQVVRGPLSLVSRLTRLPFEFSAALLGGERPCLIILQDRRRLTQLSRIEAAIQSVMASGDWALQTDGQKNAMQLRREDGSLPTYNDVTVIAVLTDVSTVFGFHDLPRTKIRLLSLPDFVTIFDSIETLEELDRYWAFLDREAGIVSPFSGPVDRFAAFRESHALLADGAIVPTMIALDPHWGSSWRYRALSEYWASRPHFLPERLNSQWLAKCDADGLRCLTAKRIPAMSWCASVGNCDSHFVLIAGEQDIELVDGRILELLTHCLADAINQRQEILSNLALFSFTQIVTFCRARMDALSSLRVDHASDEALFSDWQILKSRDGSSVECITYVNLLNVQKYVSATGDSSFEVHALLSWIDGVSSRLGLTADPSTLKALQATASRRPRFALELATREVDVPDDASPIVPDLEHYKVARRDLAIAFRNVEAQPGKYEFNESKVLIDQARDNYRAVLHEMIAKFECQSLARFCVEQMDELITSFDRKQKRIQMSLKHDVNYDRAETLAKAHDQFVKDTRNYRYLLEARLSMASLGSKDISPEAVVQLIAYVDWLLVLNGASDVLHNDIDAAGLELDESFIPHVYYSRISDKEHTFANEAADFRLGVGLIPGDEVQAARPGGPEWVKLDEAFRQDTGLTLSKYVASLSVLFRWPSANNETALNFSYSAPAAAVCETLLKSVKDLTLTEAESAISLATIRPDGIRRLLGKSVEESDVPIWEHNKRGDRYMLKPLIRNEDALVWGAASVERSTRLWMNSLSLGYMPADFRWPNVRRVTQEIKSQLDTRLESAACAVLERTTPHVAPSIDFARRFPAEGFDDVGDFDGLAYWPALNRWLSVECKYNQPAFCLKDARRLRERIFGRPGKERAQFEKIERRSAFLRANVQRVCELLGWPPAPSGSACEFYDVYVSREIYWWMRNPPYKVSTHFVRVDALESWLQAHGLKPGGN